MLDLERGAASGQGLGPRGAASRRAAASLARDETLNSERSVVTDSWLGDRSIRVPLVAGGMAVDVDDPVVDDVCRIDTEQEEFAAPNGLPAMQKFKKQKAILIKIIIIGNFQLKIGCGTRFALSLFLSLSLSLALALALPCFIIFVFLVEAGGQIADR